MGPVTESDEQKHPAEDPNNLPDGFCLSGL